MRFVPLEGMKFGGNAVQERKRAHLYPFRARKMAEIRYRRGKSAICTLSEQEKWRKSGTGAEK